MKITITMLIFKTMIIMISLKKRNYKYFVGVVDIVFNDYDDDDDDDSSDDDNHDHGLTNDEELQVLCRSGRYCGWASAAATPQTISGDHFIN